MRHARHALRLMVLCVFAMAQNEASAFLGWGKFDVYSCQSKNEALSCKSSCKKLDANFEFEVNVDRNVVIQKVFEGGVLTNSGPFENCSVANKNNWQCGKGEYRVGTSLLIDRDAMIDGVYFQETKYSNGSSSYLCAKR